MRSLRSYRAMTESGTRSHGNVNTIVAEIMDGRPILRIPRPEGPYALPQTSGAERGGLSLSLSDITLISQGKPMTIDQVDWLLATVASHRQVVSRCVVFSARFLQYLSDSEKGMARFTSTYHNGVFQMANKTRTTGDSPNPVPFMSLSDIMIPFLVDEKHWCLALLRPTENRTISLLDPCGSDESTRKKILSVAAPLVTYATRLETLEAMLGTVVGTWNMSFIDTVNDPDVVESGAYVCAYARAILTGSGIGSVERGMTKKLRMEICTLALELVVCEEGK